MVKVKRLCGIDILEASQLPVSVMGNGKVSGGENQKAGKMSRMLFPIFPTSNVINRPWSWWSRSTAWSSWDGHFMSRSWRDSASWTGSWSKGYVH